MIKVYLVESMEPYGESHFIISIHKTLEGAQKALKKYNNDNDINNESFESTFIQEYNLDD